MRTHACSLAVASSLLLAACTSTPVRMTPLSIQSLRVTTHRGDDDLLTGGLGLAGLRNAAPPAFADAERPTPQELRRRALWTNWRGIADLAPEGGYGEVYGSFAPVTGREFSALATVPGARHPHRVLVQVPDAFDRAKPCIVVTASSGSRGIYGAIAVAGAWGLPRGCAVAYTDKAAGTDYFDRAAQAGTRADGTIASRADALAFAPADTRMADGVAIKHAHSGDNPEADWGRHVEQAARFALDALNDAHADGPRLTFDSTRVIAVGLSNGGGAVLRAAELEGDWLDGVVAGAPNVHVAGARPLFDVDTEAALLMPCALPQLGFPAMPYADVRCAALAAEGVLPNGDVAIQRKAAYAQLLKGGWTDATLRSAAVTTGFDLWRAIGATYASAYGGFDADTHPCGYTCAAIGSNGSARASTAVERAAWNSDASGIAPGAGVMLIEPADRLARDAADPTRAGLQCLRGLWTGRTADAQRVQAGIAATRALPPRGKVPVLVVHGADDGLIAPAFTSTPYVAAARAAGANVRYWQVGSAQHFDAFIALPGMRARHVALIPYIHHALDRMAAHLDGAPLPGDAVIAPTVHPQALRADDLKLPRD